MFLQSLTTIIGIVLYLDYRERKKNKKYQEKVK